MHTLWRMIVAAAVWITASFAWAEGPVFQDTNHRFEWTANTEPDMASYVLTTVNESTSNTYRLTIPHPQTMATFPDAQVLTNGQWDAYLNARDTSGNPSPESEHFRFELRMPAVPAAPLIVAPVYGAAPVKPVDGKVSLVWTGQAASWKVWVHKGGTDYDPCEQVLVACGKEVTEPTLTIPVEAGATYDFWVIALNQVGQASPSSGSSFTVEEADTTPPAKPVDLRVTELERKVEAIRLAACLVGGTDQTFAGRIRTALGC